MKTTEMKGLTELLKDRLATLKEMQATGVKYQYQQGTKEDIYRIKRELSKLEKESKNAIA